MVAPTNTSLKRSSMVSMTAATNTYANSEISNKTPARAYNKHELPKPKAYVFLTTNGNLCLRPNCLGLLPKETGYSYLPHPLDINREC
jgi:hypothetical protein